MTADSIRLPNTEQRVKVIDEYPVEGYTRPTDGTKPKRYGYVVVVVAGREARKVTV